MKSYSFLAAVVLIGITASCNLFSSGKKQQNPMLGNWRLDSLSSKDSTVNPGLLLLAMAASDSGNNTTDFYFTKDSVYYDFRDGDTTRAAYQFNAEKNILVLKEDQEPQQFHYALLPDSTVLLTGEDSVTLYLKRKR